LTLAADDVSWRRRGLIISAMRARVAAAPISALESWLDKAASGLDTGASVAFADEADAAVGPGVDGRIAAGSVEVGVA
jgi:hypothetical protein